MKTIFVLLMLASFPLHAGVIYDQRSPFYISVEVEGEAIKLLHCDRQTNDCTQIIAEPILISELEALRNGRTPVDRVSPVRHALHWGARSVAIIFGGVNFLGFAYLISQGEMMGAALTGGLVYGSYKAWQDEDIHYNSQLAKEASRKNKWVPIAHVILSAMNPEATVKLEERLELRGNDDFKNTGAFQQALYDLLFEMKPEATKCAVFR